MGRKEKREQYKKQIIDEIKKVHASVSPLDLEIQNIFIKGLKALKKGQNPEYVAYNISRQLKLLCRNRYDYQNNRYYQFPEPIEELIWRFDDIGIYFIRLQHWHM